MCDMDEVSLGYTNEHINKFCMRADFEETPVLQQINSAFSYIIRHSIQTNNYYDCIYIFMVIYDWSFGRDVVIHQYCCHNLTKIFVFKLNTLCFIFQMWVISKTRAVVPGVCYRHGYIIETCYYFYLHIELFNAAIRYQTWFHIFFDRCVIIRNNGARQYIYCLTCAFLIQHI